MHLGSSPSVCRSRCLQPLDDRESSFRSEHADHLCQAVGQDSLRRHDGNVLPADESDPRARIDDVRIALAVDDDVLLSVAGGGHGAVGQEQQHVAG